ncbi:MAG: FAD binding domain-containing protein [Burkholderiales bacterium]
MKAPAFAYVKPASLAEAFEHLQNSNAKVLAGGQSLIPSLNMRLSSPELLVDIGGLKELQGISVKDGTVRIGALATHAELQKSGEIAQHVPLLAQAVPYVAHAAIRNRGTIGGSLALADPAAEYPAVAVALEAAFIVRNKNTIRRIEAARFFKGLFETDLKAGELLISVEFPAAKATDRSVFLELARRHGDYAIVGLAAHNERFVFLGAGDKPMLFSFRNGLDEARKTLKAGLKPAADLYNTQATKLHLAGVLLERAWTMLSTSR